VHPGIAGVIYQRTIEIPAEAHGNVVNSISMRA
jgi:hypothetical protein